ncbi:NmrA/HSCARG family protein [Promicromonospora panici]|uniref:NmrA/HSCARG family protein n=1 Tax=Promicromonospora panici TaxID=2219658 RepID=UPI00101D05C8|nr:NmrA/HSCARG family protein [Promicromonospora panici]
MTSTQQPSVAVIGATGQQGRSVVDALHELGVPVRALVRNPDSPTAQALRATGAEVVQADQEDSQSLADGLADVAALFYMTTFEGPDGPAGEVRRGHAVADAAARAKVPHVVYSSVGGAERETGIPHFESKFDVEKRLRALVPATILRPTFFMENLAAQLTPNEEGEIVIRMPMPGDVPVQMVAVRDIGRAAARLLLEPGAIDGTQLRSRATNFLWTWWPPGPAKCSGCRRDSRPSRSSTSATTQTSKRCSGGSPKGLRTRLTWRSHGRWWLRSVTFGRGWSRSASRSWRSKGRGADQLPPRLRFRAFIAPSAADTRHRIVLSANKPRTLRTTDN